MQEAGGVVTDLRGNALSFGHPLMPEDTGILCAASPELHRSALRVLERLAKQ